MSLIDPRTYFLGGRFTLSDLMGCDSVYRYGIPNPIREADTEKLNEGHHMIETIYPYFQTSPVSVTYGYISPGLSRSIVRYQDPNKPSYHRWDYGAAMDMIVYNTNLFDVAPNGKPFSKFKPWDDDKWYRQVHKQPIRQIRDFYLDGLRWSRAITYAESQIFCFGTRKNERAGQERMATYENQYEKGHKKPRHIKHSITSLTQARPTRARGWMGRGWPSYHGGGRRQYEHIATGAFNVLSDFLYDAILTSKGGSNRPPVGRAYGRFIYNVMVASLFYEMLVAETGRLPIIAAYVNPAARHCAIDRSYDESFILDIGVPPDELDLETVVGSADESLLKRIQTNGPLSLVRFYGKDPQDLPPEFKSIVDARYRAELAVYKRGIRGVEA